MLSTMKFAIWTLIVLGVLSLVGMFIGEFHDPRLPVRPAQSYGETVLRGAIQVFQLDDPFRSWWYRLLLFALCLSLFACVWKRLPIVWRVWTSPPPNLSHPRNNPNAISRSVDLPRDDLLTRLGARWRFRVKTEEVWVGERGRLGMWGPPLTHLGMLLLGVGSLVTSFGGLNFRAGGYSGDVLEFDNMSFAVRIDSFRVRYYPLQPLQTVLVDEQWLGQLEDSTADGDWSVLRWSETGLESVVIELDRIRNHFDYDRDRGNIRKFSSYVTVIEDGEEVEKREVAVNDPLRRDGFRFYQSSYDTDHPRYEADFDSVSLSLTDQAGDTVQNLILYPGKAVIITGDTLSVMATRLLPDFKIGSRHTKYSMTDRFINPGLKLEFTSPDGFHESSWVFLNFPQTGQPGQFDYHLDKLHGERAREELATIFQIKYTVGVEILWAGFIICTLGLLFTFYMTHRMLYILWPRDGSSRTQIIGISHRMPIIFAQDLDRTLGHHEAGGQMV